MIRDMILPHEGNNHLPRILHARRWMLYAATSVVAKMLVIAALVAMPSVVFLSDTTFGPRTEAIVARVNVERVRVGLTPYAPREELQQSATARAEDLAAHQYFSHVGPQGQALDQFLRAAGYPYEEAGENLAMGFADADAVVRAWMRSPSHRANVLAPDFRDIGIGIASGSRDGRAVVYIVQHTGRERRVAVIPQPRRPTLDPASSFVAWAPEDDGTRVTVYARTREPLTDARASIGADVVSLHQVEGGVLTGTAVLPAAPERLFAVTVPPEVRGTTARGETVVESIPWERPLVPTASAFQRYTQGTAYLAATHAPLLRTARFVFGFLLTIAAALLILSITTELHRKHPHVVARTVVLAGILIAFLVF